MICEIDYSITTCDYCHVHGHLHVSLDLENDRIEY